MFSLLVGSSRFNEITWFSSMDLGSKHNSKSFNTIKFGKLQRLQTILIYLLLKEFFYSNYLLCKNNKNKMFNLFTKSDIIFTVLFSVCYTNSDSIPLHVIIQYPVSCTFVFSKKQLKTYSLKAVLTCWGHCPVGWCLTVVSSLFPLAVDTFSVHVDAKLQCG